MFKYYVNGEEVNKEAYEDELIMDAEDNGMSKTNALQVARENRKEAKEEGSNTWMTSGGWELKVEYSKGGK